MILVVQTKRSVGAVTRNRARRSRGCVIVQLGEVRNQIPEGLGKWRHRAKTSNEGLKRQRRITSHPLGESSWRTSRMLVRNWESGKHRRWVISADGFWRPCHHRWLFVGSSGQLGRVREWSAVQLVYDKQRDRCTACTERSEAEVEVQCTVKRAELTAFVCLFKAIVVSATAEMWITNVSLMVLWRSNEVHRPTCEGRRLAGYDMGGGSQSSRRRHTGGSRARQRASFSEGENKIHSSRNSSMRAMRRQTSKGRMER